MYQLNLEDLDRRVKDGQPSFGKDDVRALLEEVRNVTMSANLRLHNFHLACDTIERLERERNALRREIEQLVLDRKEV